ncbi:hypothetical protein E0Z10_g9838 [Xylaria hypoxylon]|uniref:Uncharacterized protein n=1 Tax=Xylaria hypoxylon TaxID=37992 RepID=A0A4Z0Y563_9PEZI|nr:hypothetical protein E0Z10_g9838 [Xylaria hypoxylon]
MASKPLFDPLVFLRLAPVLTSTMAMRFSHDQYLFLDNLLAPEHSEKAKEIVPSYFTTFFMRGIWDIGILYTLTTATGITNFYSRPNGAWKWYAAGTALALFHMAFVPFVMYQVKGLADGASKDGASKDGASKDGASKDGASKDGASKGGASKEEGPRLLREWLKVHTLRSWMADIPAWTCFVIGCVKSLQPL